MIMFGSNTPSPTISVSQFFTLFDMTIFAVLRKISTLLLLSLALVLFGGCALFQPNDCETEELPDEILTVD